MATTTFIHEHVADARRRVTVEIGDAKQPDFHPQLKTLHWGNECNFSVRLVDEHPAADAQHWAHADGRVEWRKGPRGAIWYPLEAGGHDELPHLLEDGGHEFEVHLLEPPASNVLRFTVRAKGLRFLLQPPLDPDDPEDAASTRPDAVVGSYAVYHEERAGNFDDVHYRTGKAFHLLRPWAEDAAGARAWCELRIPDDGNGTATVTVPAEFLESARYPVVVDPTFGYTSIGATSANLNQGTTNADVATLHSPYTAVSGATLTLVSLYCNQDSGGFIQFDLSAYTISGGVAVTQVVTPQTLTPSTTGAWVSTSALSVALTNGTVYGGGAWGNYTTATPQLTVYRDTGSGAERDITTTGALPATWSSAGTSASIYSVYATYTASVTPPGAAIVAPNPAVTRASRW